MTDNEKRAHDLTVAWLPSFIDIKTQDLAEKMLKEDSATSNLKVTTNLEEDYISLYQSFLKFFEKTFPQD